MGLKSKIKGIFSIFLILVLFACNPASEPENENPTEIILNFSHSKISGSDISLNKLLRNFEKQNQGVRIQETR